MDKLEQWTESKFEGLSRDELREAGKILGCTFGPNTAEHTMRLKLCEIAGQGVEAPVVQEQPKANTETLALRPRFQRPKLNAKDVWEGRRHRVRVHRGAGAEQHKSFVLYWDGEPRSFPYDEEIDMPEPYFNVMKQAKIGTVKQKPRKDESGLLIAIENFDVFSPRYSFDYLGVSQGTENLPGSVLEYWQKLAPKKDYFRNLVHKPGGRKALIQIRADLYDSAPPEYYKDLTNEDILADILRFLGFEELIYESLDEAIA